MKKTETEKYCFCCFIKQLKRDPLLSQISSQLHPGTESFFFTSAPAAAWKEKPYLYSAPKSSMQMNGYSALSHASVRSRQRSISSSRLKYMGHKHPWHMVQLAPDPEPRLSDSHVHLFKHPKYHDDYPHFLRTEEWMCEHSKCLI